MLYPDLNWSVDGLHRIKRRRLLRRRLLQQCSPLVNCSQNMSLGPAQGFCLVKGSFCMPVLLAQETSSWFLWSIGNTAAQSFSRTCDPHCSPFPCASSSVHISGPLYLFEIFAFCADAVNLPHVLLPCSDFQRCLSCEAKPPQPHFGSGARLFLVLFLQPPTKMFFVSVNRLLIIL